MRTLYLLLAGIFLNCLSLSTNAQCPLEYSETDAISGKKHFKTKPIPITLFKTNLENGYAMKHFEMSLLKNEDGLQVQFSFQLTNMRKKTALYDENNDALVLRFEDGSIDTLRLSIPAHMKEKKRRAFCELTFALSPEVIEKIKRGLVIDAFKIDSTSFDISLNHLIPAFSGYFKECLKP